MSTIERVRLSLPTGRSRAALARVREVVLGDRIGSLLFVGALLFFLSYWRVGIFVNDNYTIANTLVALADGHLHVPRIVYGPPSGATPGMRVADGRRYGRNYGLVFFALPFLWAIEAIATVADPRVAISALWSLLALGVSLGVGSLLGSERAFALLGSSVALAALAGNVALATPLDPRWFPLIALQASTMVAAALLGVLVYRLLARICDRRVGAVGGAVTVLATPVGFWASIPKRHTLVALLVLCVVYSLYRSRSAATTRASRRFRALAYAWVGLATWVNVAEGVVLLVALLAIDLPTARSNDRRTLGTVAGAFCLSLVPFFLTNAAISGNPVVSPQLLARYSSEGQLLSGARSSSSTAGPTGTAVKRMTHWSVLLSNSVFVAIEQPRRLFRTFVRSGYLERIAQQAGYEMINLSILESMPLAGTVLALPAYLARQPWERDRPAPRRWLEKPTAVVDALAIVYAIGLTLVYLPRLPIHAQVTVRYLHPLVPIAVYGGLRLPALRRAVIARHRIVCWTYATAVLIGGQLLLAAIALTDATLGEAFQLHAWIGLLAAFALGGATTIGVVREGPPARFTGRAIAIAFGLAAGAGTVFVLLSGLLYFSSVGNFALPIVERLVEAISIPAVHEVGS